MRRDVVEILNVLLKPGIVKEHKLNIKTQTLSEVNSPLILNMLQLDSL